MGSYFVRLLEGCSNDDRLTSVLKQVRLLCFSCSAFAVLLFLLWYFCSAKRTVGSYFARLLEGRSNGNRLTSALKQVRLCDALPSVQTLAGAALAPEEVPVAMNRMLAQLDWCYGTCCSTLL